MLACYACMFSQWLSDINKFIRASNFDSPLNIMPRNFTVHLFKLS